MTAHVLVTGGAGFIGSHLCDALIARGDAVTCLDDLSTGRRANVAHLVGHPRFTFVEHDARRPYAHPVDAVFNLACPASPIDYQRDPIGTLDTCYLGTRNALALGHARGALVVQASTSEVYGDPAVHPQPESYWGHVNPTGPRACYDEGKRAAEALCAAYARHHGARVRVARIFNTYGPRMRRDDGRVVPAFLDQLCADRPLTVFGDGGQTRSFCYVDDLVRGLLALLDRPDVGPEPVNLGNPAETSIAALARLVSALAARPLPIERRPLPVDDPRRRRPDITRARAVLGWAPEVALADGLRRTLDAFVAERAPALDHAR